MISKTFDSAFGITFDSCKKALVRIGADLTHVNKTKGTIIASFGFSLLSWGEAIQVIIAKKGEHKTSVTVKSKSENQLIDWGKNSRNEREFFGELTKIIKRK